MVVPMTAALHRLALRCLVGLALCLAGTLVASAQPVGKRVEKGLSEFQDLEFKAAIATLNAALKNPELTKGKRMLALELIAISYISLGKEKLAKTAFRELLLLKPSYKLRNHDGSPKIESLFEMLREQLPKEASPPPALPPPEVEPNAPSPVAESTKITNVSSGKAQAGTSYLVAAKAPASTKEMQLVWWVGAQKVRLQPMRKSDGQWRATISLPTAVSGYQVAYYMVAKGVATQVIATLGSKGKPKKFSVSIANSKGAAPARSGGNAWYGSWKVWTGILFTGAVTTGAVFYLRGSENSEANLPPKSITLTP